MRRARRRIQGNLSQGLEAYSIEMQNAGYFVGSDHCVPYLAAEVMVPPQLRQ